MCQRSKGYLYGKFEEGGAAVYDATVLDCGSWQCPECRPRKAKAVLARAYNGEIARAAQVAGFRERYNFKLLTLTCPGGEYRQTHTPAQAAVEMRDSLSKLFKALKKDRGDFKYIRVLEAQRDGFPHYHVLLCGASIAPKEVLEQIERLWVGRYHMGFVRINQIKGGVNNAIRYCLKYLFKAPSEWGRLRLFSAAREAIAKPFESARTYLKSPTRFGGFAYRGIDILERQVNWLKRNPEVIFLDLTYGYGGGWTSQELDALRSIGLPTGDCPF